MPELRVDEKAAPSLRELRFLRRAHCDFKRVIGIFSIIVSRVSVAVEFPPKTTTQAPSLFVTVRIFGAYEAL
jgi:hypothetical protein